MSYFQVAEGIGHTRHSTNEDWTRARSAGRFIMQRGRVVELLHAAVKRVRAWQSEHERIAWCWSGGKDSVVLGRVMELAGVSDCMMATTAIPDIPAVAAWLVEHAPPGLAIDTRTDMDLKWLAKNPQHLFPLSGEDATFFINAAQRIGQKRYYDANGLDIMLTGRRTMDGNFAPLSLVDGKRRSWGSPICDWTNEETMAVMAWERLPFHPNYDHPDGWVNRTNPWWHQYMQVGGIDATWALLAGIDSDFAGKMRDEIRRHGGE